MAAGFNLPAFPSFDVETDKSNAGPRWGKWVERLENLFIGLDIDDVDRKRALLLHYAGERVYDIYDAEKKETAATYDATKKVLKDYFDPKRNIQMEIYKFRSYKQLDGQSLDEFVTELRKLAKNCQFANTDNEILTQVIQNCRSNRLRRRALREPDKTLDHILATGRALEMADAQALTMERETVNKVQSTQRTVRRQPQKQSDQRRNAKPQYRSDKPKQHKHTCRNCGGQYPHTNECPAKGKKCNFCSKLNHFSKVCRQRLNPRQENVREVQNNKVNKNFESSSDEEYTYHIKHESEHVSVVGSKTPRVNICINNKHCNFLLDTGATVNLLDQKTYHKIGAPKMTKGNNPNLLPYGGGDPLKVMGKCQLNVESKNTIDCDTFYVVQGNHGALLGYPLASKLGLVKIINQITDPKVKYPKLFEGIGKYKGTPIKLHIDEHVKPVAQRHRRTPFHLRGKVEKELVKLQEQDIIEKIEGTPTPWVSPIVTPPKKNPDEIRLCVDMREANKAISRERHMLPTIDELIHDLTGATLFTKLDLRSGYHQLELHPSSRYITTFSTHAGLFCYKRLNFGISSASEIFQEVIRNVISGIPGVKNISDDIIIYGKSQAEHDKALDATFKRLLENGLTLNLEKCEFNKDQVVFFGVTFSKEGISPDPKKVTAIKDMSPPKNVPELRSFLGMTTYSSRFIQNYATLCEPLRRLTRQDTDWNWGSEQEVAFENLKCELSSDTVMTYFNQKHEIDILVDASPVGLGAIMSQEGKNVAYASRSLTDTETRYSQTEREALAIVWACEHFDMYIRGAPNVNVITDHKPLERIWQKPKPPLRIERWGLRLQPYKLKITYRPGSENPADFMSRHPSDNPVKSREQSIAEQYVRFVVSEAVPRAMTLDEVKMASSKDKTIQKAIEFVRTGQWFKVKNIADPEMDIEELQALRSINGELVTYSDTILLRDNRIVLPSELRARAVNIAHEGHQGITKTKAFLRSKIWFPGLNDRVDNAIKDCAACQSVTHTKRIEPLRMSELPEKPWANLSADFCGPLPSGDILFVITDEYSRYPVVEIIKSDSASTVIPVLDKVISIFGIPKVIKTDNGPPFNSHAFRQYAENTGFEHRRVTPLWPRANAQAESFNKPMMKTIKTAHVEGKSWKQELFKFLRQYRATPHTSTGYPPFQLLFNREPITKLPQVYKQNIINKQMDENARQNDESAKCTMKQQFDERNHAKPCNIEIGNSVLRKTDRRENKLTPAYEPNPYTVINRKGSMITVTNGDKLVTRNSSKFKKVNRPQVQSSTDEIEEQFENISDTKQQNIQDQPPSPRIVQQPTPQSLQRSERPVRQKHVPKYLKDYVR